MVYSFHHFYKWVRGGLEYAQVHRAKILRNAGIDAKFIFTTMFEDESFLKVMEDMGFLDTEVMWALSYLTDCKTSPVTYTLRQLEESFGDETYMIYRDGRMVRYSFPGTSKYYQVTMDSPASDYVYKVDTIVNGCLLRRDFYTYCKIYSEYYSPINGRARLYERKFFNEDGTIAFEEIMDGANIMYRLPDSIFYSESELLCHIVSGMKLTGKDVVLVDTAMGTIDIAAIIQGAAPARVGLVMHSNHYVEGETDEEHVQWHVFYEYALSHPERMSFFVASTDMQNHILQEQFRRRGSEASVVTIPPASLDELKIPKNGRKRHSIITASRLASEKKVDWIVRAVAAAKELVPDISLDIYGEGVEEGKIRRVITELQCGEYVRLCGHQQLDEVYQQYEVYVTASVSEPFGITLMEAVGAGLPVIGFDVPYGGRTFIDDGENGYLIPWKNIMGEKARVEKIAECIVRLFTEADLEAFHEHSYKKAEIYLTKEVEKRWVNLLKGTE